MEVIKALRRRSGDASINPSSWERTRRKRFEIASKLFPSLSSLFLRVLFQFRNDLSADIGKGNHEPFRDFRAGIRGEARDAEPKPELFTGHDSTSRS